MTERHLRAALDAMLDPCLLVAVVRQASGEVADLVYIDANIAACAALGLPREDIVGSGARNTLPPQAASDLIDACTRVTQGDGYLQLTDHRYDVGEASGARWFDLRIVRIDDALSITWHDVTERHLTLEELSRSERRFRLLAENSSDFVYFADAEGRASWVAPSVTRTLGWLPEDIVGMIVTDLVHPDDWDVVVALGEAATGGTEVIALRPGVAHPILARLRQADGHYRWMSVTATRVHEQGSAEHSLVVGMRDVDELVATQELAERGQRDDLTGLVNRPSLLERMERILAESRRASDLTAVLYCDVDHFKEINDTFGHAVGDEVLRTIAMRIRQNVRENDIVARLGGDEFVVVLQGLTGPSDAEAVSNKIRSAMREALLVDGIDLSRSFSIGVAMVAPDSTPDRVLRDADAALYEAKEAGRDRTVTHRGRRRAS